MQKSLWLLALAAFAIVIIIGCGGRGMDSSTLTSASTGNSGANSGGSTGSTSPGSGSSSGSGSAGSGSSGSGSGSAGSGGSGGSGSGSGSNSPAPSQFVYVATESSTPEPCCGSTFNDQIFAFSIDAQSGALTSIGSMQSDPITMVRDPNDLSFYAAGFRDEVAIGYTVSTSGTPQIESVQGHFNTGFDVAITPDGRFVYVTGGGHAFSIYSAQEGNLTPVSVFPSGSGAASNGDPIISPNGKFLFAHTSDLSTSKTLIQSYRIGTHGSLSPSATSTIAAVVPGTQGWAIDDSGTFLYAFDGAGNDSAIHILLIDQSSGAVTESSSSPQTLAVPTAGTIGVSPQNVLYIDSKGVLAAYSINPSNGNLQLVGTAASGSNTINLSIDRSGRFIYVLDYATSSVFAFSASTNGAPQPVIGSPFAVNSPAEMNRLLAD